MRRRRQVPVAIAAFAAVLALWESARVAAQASATISGRARVADSGEPLPGVAVTIDGPDRRRQVMTGVDGAFTADALIPGSCGVTVALVGFVEQHREIGIDAGAAVRLDFDLKPAPVEPDLVVTPDRELIAEASAIAHLRIERTAPPEPCGSANGALHRAAVVAVARGRLAPWIGYWQGGVGYCRTASGAVIAPEVLFVPGDELLVFMRGPAPLYRSLAGTLTELRVVDGRLDRDFGPLREGMTVVEALAALAR